MPQLLRLLFLNPFLDALRLDGYNWLIDNTVDTTTKSTDYTYDHIILTDTTDLSGDYGIFRYDLEYGFIEKNRFVILPDGTQIVTEQTKSQKEILKALCA